MEAVLEGSRLGVDSFMKELPVPGEEKCMVHGKKELQGPKAHRELLRTVEMGVHFNDAQEEGNRKKLYLAQKYHFHS